LSPSRLAQRLEEKHPEFFRVKIKKQFPPGLLVEIQPRKAVVAIGQKESEFYLVDKEGVLLEKTSGSTNLPLILTAAELQQEKGTKIKDQLLLTAIQILYQSQLRLLEPELLKLTSRNVAEVWLRGRTQVLFSLRKDIKEQLDSLQFIYQRAKIEGNRLQRVDLRFDKPVIIK